MALQIRSIFDFQRKHYDIIVSLVDKKTYCKCHYCGKETKTEDAMYKHVINEHFDGDVNKAWGDGGDRVAKRV
jgi:hypothetical protein